MRPYSLFDQDPTTLAFVWFSLPTFFTGLLFILFFSIYLDWLPFIYRADSVPRGLAWLRDQVKQSIMPVAVLGLFQAASLTRFVRSSVLDVIRLDYINTARAKGLSERITIVKHVVRNALIPVVTAGGAPDPAHLHGRDRHRADLPGSRDRLPAHRLDPGQRHPGDHGHHLRVLDARGRSSTSSPTSLYGWLDPRISYR